MTRLVVEKDFLKYVKDKHKQVKITFPIIKKHIKKLIMDKKIVFFNKGKVEKYFLLFDPLEKFDELKQFTKYENKLQFKRINQ